MSIRPDLLSTTRLALRGLVWVNILGVVLVAALFVSSFVVPQWLQAVLGFLPDAPPSLFFGVRLNMLICLFDFPLAYFLLTRLIAVVDSVRDGDPFTAANAHRLKAIAFAMLGTQLLTLAAAGVEAIASSPGHPLDMGITISVEGWLAVFLLFILARIFDIGTRMRADLDGTV